MKKEKLTPSDRFTRNAILVRVVDGDTLDVEIDLGWSMILKERVRLEKVNTPEVKGEKEREAGKWVKKQVQKWIKPEDKLIITSIAYERTGKIRGKHGRTIASVYVVSKNNKIWCLNNRLLKEKIAWQTDEKGKIKTKRNLKLLTGIPSKFR